MSKSKIPIRPIREIQALGILSGCTIVVLSFPEISNLKSIENSFDRTCKHRKAALDKLAKAFFADKEGSEIPFGLWENNQCSFWAEGEAKGPAKTLTEGGNEGTHRQRYWQIEGVCVQSGRNWLTPWRSRERSSSYGKVSDSSEMRKRSLGRRYLHNVRNVDTKPSVSRNAKISASYASIRNTPRKMAFTTKQKNNL